MQCNKLIGGIFRRKRKFCSQRCSALYRNEHGRRITKTCLMCNKTYTGPAHKYCSVECSKHAVTLSVAETKAQRKILFSQGKLKLRQNIKPLIKERDGHKCSICKLTQWNNKDIPLVLDHIDGDASNNDPSNFRLVCRNCEAFLPTFVGRNKGNGRQSRGMKYWE